RAIAPLNVADLAVGDRQLLVEIVIAGAFARKLVEISKRAHHQQLTRGGRAVQILDGIVQLEQQRVRELAHAREIALGARLLLLRDARLVRGGDDAAHQRAGDERRGGELDLVPAYEFAGAIAEMRAMREHGLASEITLDVRGELLD